VLKVGTASVVIFYSFIEALLAKLSILFLQKTFCIPGLVSVLDKKMQLERFILLRFLVPVQVSI
jgi:hypothetical protein